MVEMHLLSVNVDFGYDPIYALGVVTSFDRFMQGYQPEQDKASIFNALCKSLDYEPEKYRQDAEELLALARGLGWEKLIGWLAKETVPDSAGRWQETISQIASNPSFKYSRLFAIGLYVLLEGADPDLVKDEKQREQALQKIAIALNLPEEKISKDLDLYRSNLDKIAQAQIVMKDMIEAERKKREKRAQEQQQKENPTEEAEVTSEDKADSDSDSDS